MVERFFGGATGSIIRLTVEEDGSAVDISGASAKQLVLRRPVDNAQFIKTASFTNSGTDGKLQYTDSDGLLLDKKDPAIYGVWSVCAKLTGLSSWSGYSTVAHFEVVRPLET